MRSLLAMFAATLLVQASSAALITIDPDDFAPGAEISNAVPGVTFSRVLSEFEDTRVFAIEPDEPEWAATGSLVFGHSGNAIGAFDEQWVLDTSPGFQFGALRVDFADGATLVDIAVIGNNIPDFGRLEAYDADGQLLASVNSGELLPGDVERLEISGVGEISYVIAGGLGNETVSLDSLRFIPEPASIGVLLAGLALALRRR